MMKYMPNVSLIAAQTKGPRSNKTMYDSLIGFPGGVLSTTIFTSGRIIRSNNTANPVAPVKNTIVNCKLNFVLNWSSIVIHCNISLIMAEDRAIWPNSVATRLRSIKVSDKTAKLLKVKMLGKWY